MPDISLMDEFLPYCVDWYDTSCVLDVKLVLQPAAKVIENNTKS